VIYSHIPQPLLPVMKDKQDENEVRKAVLELAQRINVLVDTLNSLGYVDASGTPHARP
jgi:hypothetical protein